MSSLQRKLLRDLWHLRGQMLSAALVLACGAGAFVAMRGTYHSLAQAQRDYYATYRFADVFAHLERAPETVVSALRAVPGVVALRTRVVEEVLVSLATLPEPATVRLISVPARRQAMLNDLHLRAGRYIESGRDDEVLVSEAFARANGLGLHDTLGAVLNGRWKRLRVVGIALSPEYIYEVGAGGLVPDNRRFGVMWMGEQALQAAFDMEGAFNDCVLTLAHDARPREVMAALDRLLAPYGGNGAYDRDEQLSHRFISDEIAQNRVSSTWIPGIFFSVAAFLLNIVLSRLVNLQRAEIGLLKAFGYTRAAIARHYVELALVAVLPGVVFGTGLGLYLGGALTALYRDYYRFPSLQFAVQWQVIAGAAAIAIAVATLGALASVRSAVLLPAAEAMRPPAPARFRAGWLERHGILRYLSPPWRMILRHFLRRRWISLLSVLSIASAAGILVVGGFFLDALDELLRVQFEQVQRDAVTVRFQRGRGADSAFDLARLAGVRRVEEFRAIPVRLHLSHRSRRLELLGMRPGGELRRLLDADRQPVALPPHGLVLTTGLARILGAQQGSMVTVEVLEGRRPQIAMRVDALVDELVGLGAYMDLAALNRAMGDAQQVSGAWLSVDPTQSGALYAQLAGMPAVSGITFRAATLASFKDILARSVNITTIINIAFACMIAIGVVYNGARVALSEQGNDLASLRVLGFNQQEVSLILLGEQALVTLLALPCGLAAGYATCALLAARLDTELYRIPLVVSSRTLVMAAALVLAASVLSGSLVARRLRALDLVAVLKTRE